MRIAIEPAPNEHRGDMLLPTAGHALAFFGELEHAAMVGLNPRSGHGCSPRVNITLLYAQPFRDRPVGDPHGARRL